MSNQDATKVNEMITYKMIAYTCICTGAVPCYGYGECGAIGGECRLTRNSKYSLNGYCEDPENHPERFKKEEHKYSDKSDESKTLYCMQRYIERSDYVKPRYNI